MEWGPVRIELHQALCLVRSGDPSQGARHATATLARLPVAHRTVAVVGLGEQVLAAVPPGERRHAAVQELRQLVAPEVTPLQHP